MKSFIDATREVVWLRAADRLMIIRPNKIQHLNDTAFEMLYGLYHEGLDIDGLTARMSASYGMTDEAIAGDLARLLESIGAIMNDDYARAPLVGTIEFDPASVTLPVLSEIALTYRCQNRCDFCYASSPYRGAEMREMSTAEVCRVIERIAREAQVPTISFTGGEPTLRDDLPDIVAHAVSLGMRANLITNGIRCADPALVGRLAAAGLASAQVSLESPRPAVHDDITGHPGAFEQTVAGIRNLAAAGIYTHTNTTICVKNQDHLAELAAYVKGTFGFPYLSMNMIIATGIARDNANITVGYSAIGRILKPLVDFCEVEGIRLVWYSPTPYCLFNPVDHNLGSKSCACVSGLLSVNPAGEVLPCSSYDRGMGSLLTSTFDRIWQSDQACYFRERRYVPPVCRGCEYERLCAGACPLYWERAGGFAEIEERNGARPVLRNFVWDMERRLRVRSRGVAGLSGRSSTRGV